MLPRRGIELPVIKQDVLHSHYIQHKNTSQFANLQVIYPSIRVTFIK
jgi:hypothetical protein